MKKVIIFLLMMLPMVSNAQRIDKPGEPYDYFCEVYADGSTLIINFNSEKYHEFIYGDDNKFLKIKTIDAINYMTKRGWEYVDKISTLDHFEHMLFKKKVVSDEQAFEFFKFKPKKEKSGD